MKNFTAVEPLEDVVKSTKEQTLDVWSLPAVEPDPAIDQEKTNAFGKKSTWVYEPPEEDEPELQPLTAQEIEEIRQAAQQEGFNQGKEEGFSAGFEEGQQAGHQEGLAKGIEEGTAQGLEQGQAQIEKLTQEWQMLIEQLHQPMKVIEGKVEQQLLTLVTQLTKAITLHEAKTNHEILLSAIKKGIKALPMQEAQTQIFLHPDDIQLIERELTVKVIEENGWRLQPAPHLSPGSCQIENSTSNIDLTIETRLQEVLESFLQDALHP
ncbi:flagellar assembly protein FliH [Thalassotalea ganghwensis]